MTPSTNNFPADCAESPFPTLQSLIDEVRDTLRFLENPMELTIDGLEIDFTMWDEDPGDQSHPAEPPGLEVYQITVVDPEEALRSLDSFGIEDLDPLLIDGDILTRTGLGARVYRWAEEDLYDECLKAWKQ